jgi:hypothetical protein
MPPDSSLTRALHRYMYLLTALAAASVALSVGFADAGGVDPECRGSSPKKLCPTLEPATGETVAGNVVISAHAPFATGIVFSIDDSPLGPEDTVAPFEVSWDTTKVANGQHTISATARISDEKTATAESVVEVSNVSPDTSAPDVELTNPAGGATVSSQTTVSADASDNVAVVGIQFKLDGDTIGNEDTAAPYSVVWDTSKAANGWHTLVAVARDAAGNTSASQRAVKVSNLAGGDATAPSVQLTFPAAGATVSGQTTLSADASDDVAVAGVQFKLDGANLGSEDTSAPYSVGWDTTKVANGQHTLRAVARDAAGNTASSERTVNVHNAFSIPPPSLDTTAPTVQLTSPVGGATVSAQTSVSADATDNVGVVGVQFKLDGVNLGSEDTSTPHTVSWDTTKAADGWHTLIAVARDAAGNTSASQRNVKVSNTAPAPSAPGLTWRPPTLSNPVTIDVTNANKYLMLDTSRDYILRLREKLVGRPGLWIEGGHNVVVIGGHIEIETAGTSSYWDRTAVKVRYSTGVVHLEGLLINGAYLADGIVTTAPAATLQIQNVRVENAHASGPEHPDCFQAQGGIGHLRIDRFSCSSQLQGIFLQNAGELRVGSVDMRNANLVGALGKYLFWQAEISIGPISLTNVWLKGNDPNWANFGTWVWPNMYAEGQSDPTRRAVVSADGSYLTFQNSNIAGRMYKGAPPGGDFVPRALVGQAYTSPGYGS